MTGFDSPTAELEHRVNARLAQWEASYAATGTKAASRVLDRAIAEDQVIAEMKAEGRWPTS